MKVGDLVKTPTWPCSSRRLVYNTPHYIWSNQLALVVGFDDRPGSKGYVRVVLQSTAHHCVFHKDSLSLL